MELDLKLENVIQIFDLIKGLSWGSIPLWFSLTIPVIFITYTKLLPERDAAPDNGSISGIQRVSRWFTLPRVDKMVIYTSLALFIIGTITLMIDQSHKERVRKNGLRMKQYFLAKSNYNIPRENLTKGGNKLSKLNTDDIDEVLEQYPNEFLEVDMNTITLRDSLIYNKLLETNVKLLDSYLSDTAVSKIQEIESLFNIKPYFFTREVVYKLIADSSNKYAFCVLNSGSPGIKRK